MATITPEGLSITGKELERLYYEGDPVSDGYEIVDRELDPERMRWQTAYNLILRDRGNGRTYMAYYSLGNTEYQENEFPDQTCPEVEERKVVETRWVMKDDGEESATC